MKAFMFCLERGSSGSRVDLAGHGERFVDAAQTGRLPTPDLWARHRNGTLEIGAEPLPSFRRNASRRVPRNRPPLGIQK